MPTISILPSFFSRRSAAYKEILELTETITNDQELGLKVRAIINEYQKPLPSYNYELDTYEAKYEPTPFDNYMKYVKEITDKFAEMLSVGNDYLDYASTIQENDLDTKYDFRNANSQALIDMMIHHTFEDSKELMEKIEQRHEQAKKWLSKNVMTFEEWMKVIKEQGK